MPGNHSNAVLSTEADVPQRMEMLSDEKLGFFMKAFCLILPCLNLIEFQIVGRLFLSETILTICLPLLLIRKGRMLRKPIPRTIIILGVVWLISQILTDIIRVTPFEDYSRGWAKIVFTLINFSALYIILFQKRRAIIYFAIGIAGYQVLVYFVNPSTEALGQWWKFGLGVPMVMIAVLVFQSRFIRRKPLLPTIIMMVFAVISISMGSRSLGGACFLMGSYFFIDNVSFRSPFAIRHLSIGNKIIIGLSLVVFFFGFQYMYQNVISKAAVDVKEKEKSQSEGDYGLFLGGRSEIISSFYAISDSPLLGHGSWAKNPKYDQMMYHFLRDAGYKPGRNFSDLIPTHSHLWGAWVEAGILGAVFWLFIFILTFRVFLEMYKVNEPLNFLAVFVVVTLLWSIFFSPYGATARFIETFFIIVVITVLDNIKVQKQSSEKQRLDAN
ncbi:MAG: hypothetical protein ABSB78_06755 [Bacteroidota bacterium]